MHKTSGYWFYKQIKDVAMLQEILNHSTPQITLEYIWR
ncbi:DNA integration/recombination/inversion protein [Bacillus cereus]|uniref:DNA integration/recombination/inversion protein n=1 Tax=Bacillus cereus TaxID=1396 RepID=A0A164KWU3_BACCE|nr:DNA integration/recombination/inversion protein [Bacillus cereus]